MKQVYEHYLKWEDYQNGMWRKVTKEEEKHFLQIAIDFTGNHDLYGNAMLKVIDQWPVTCRHNLTDPSLNQRAFIGHAACSLEIDCPEYIVRAAWGMLTEQQRRDANKKADIAIAEWKRRYQLSLRKENNLAIQIELFQ